MKTIIVNTFKEHRSFVLLICLMFMFRSAFADWNTVPTGSMQPTIIEGDRITVNKLAYDISLPFTNTSLYQLANPKRGDIIVFNSEAAGLRLVKRVIGIPGDTLKLERNRLTINGKTLSYTEAEAKTVTTPTTQTPNNTNNTNYSVTLHEDLLGTHHRIKVSKTGSPLSSFKTIKVPANTYLALGDNRDNSSDSRVIGFIPRKEIIGKSTHIVMSLNYDNFLIPRKGRFFKKLY